MRRLAFRTAFLVILLVSCCAANSSPLAAQQPQEQSALHQHYDNAYRLQAQGDLAGADAEHTAFLVLALQELANGRANSGDYLHAAPLYDEALALAGNDLDLRRDYAAAAIDAQDPRKAQQLLQDAVDHAPENLPPALRANANRVLASALLILGRGKDAIHYNQQALTLDPGFDSLYALGYTILNVSGASVADPIFQRLIAQDGDTAANRMAVGRAYAVAGFPDKAILQFQKALRMDPTLAGLHYSLGGAYMSLPQPDYATAEIEFKKELALHPRDPLSYPQLAHIALKRQKFNEAEIDLKRAAQLDPRNPDVFMELGQLYVQTNRSQDAEAALRQAIAVTVDPARNRYAIQRAHYELGQILLARGDKEEGRKEVEISADMLNKKRQQDISIMTGGKQGESLTLGKTRFATPQQLEEVHAFERQLAPLIAGSYNNLGVHAAMAGRFPAAEQDFAHAAQWDPALHGIDSNLGRAAFAARDCAAAVAPLARALATDPSDAELRAMLAECKRQTAGPARQ